MKMFDIRTESNERLPNVVGVEVWNVSMVQLSLVAAFPESIVRTLQPPVVSEPPWQNIRLTAERGDSEMGSRLAQVSTKHHHPFCVAPVERRRGLFF